MAKIQIKRGTKTEMPLLEVGEFGFCTDTNELFIGNGSQNLQIPVQKQDDKKG